MWHCLGTSKPPHAIRCPTPVPCFAWCDRFICAPRKKFVPIQSELTARVWLAGLARLPRVLPAVLSSDGMRCFLNLIEGGIPLCLWRGSSQRTQGVCNRTCARMPGNGAERQSTGCAAPAAVSCCKHSSCARTNCTAAHCIPNNFLDAVAGRDTAPA